MLRSVILGAALLASTSAQAAFIDFEGETSGVKANGYALGGIEFHDTVGAELLVDNFGLQGIGTRSLGVFDDDASGLEMRFGTLVTNLSLAIGNDDADYTNAGDVALLRLYSGNVQIGEVTVLLNRDDLANQTITSGALVFDMARLWYTSPDFDFTTGGGAARAGLTEIVDDISFDLANAVPEPASLALLGVGLAGLGLARRKR